MTQSSSQSTRRKARARAEAAAAERRARNLRSLEAFAEAIQNLSSLPGLKEAIVDLFSFDELLPDLTDMATGIQAWADLHPRNITSLKRRIAPFVDEQSRMPKLADIEASGEHELHLDIVRLGGSIAVARGLGLNAPKKGPCSGLELRQRPLLEPLGFSHWSIRRSRHTFDYGNEWLQAVVEINGCRYHDHAAIGGVCPVKRLYPVRAGAPSRAENDERIRQIAQAHGLKLLELWECEEGLFPARLEAFASAL